MSFEPILLAPETEQEVRYPYRRVWRTAWLEMSLLFLAVLLIVVLTDLFGVLPADWRDRGPRVGIALLPWVLWLVFSYRGERRAIQPRDGMLGMLALGALAASGVGIVLDERLFLLDDWLPRTGFFGRVIGYTLTAGMTAQFLKYAALRYTIWPGRFRQRLDGIAYALAVSLGYALVYNLRFALFTDATLTATALRVASFTFLHVAVGVIVGFFLAEMAIGRVPVFWLSLGVGLAAFVSGLYYAFRGVAIVSGLSVAGTGSAPIRGLLLAFGLVAVTFMIVAFIVASADARMQAQYGRRGSL